MPLASPLEIGYRLGRVSEDGGIIRDSHIEPDWLRLQGCKQVDLERVSAVPADELPAVIQEETPQPAIDTIDGLPLVRHAVKDEDPPERQRFRGIERMTFPKSRGRA